MQEFGAVARPQKARVDDGVEADGELGEVGVQVAVSVAEHLNGNGTSRPASLHSGPGVECAS